MSFLETVPPLIFSLGMIGFVLTGILILVTLYAKGNTYDYTKLLCSFSLDIGFMILGIGIKIFLL